MKHSIWVLAISILFSVSAFSANLGTINTPELSQLPVMDGDVENDPAWKGIEWKKMDKDGDTNEKAPTDAGNLDAWMKFAWDDETNAIYCCIHVIDNVFMNVHARGSSVGKWGYKNEALEFVMNAANTGLASDGEGSDYHAQYVFQFPNTIDALPLGMDDFPVKTTFQKLHILEAIDGHFDGANETVHNLDDKYLESVGTIRATQAGITEWFQAPVEWYIEMKIVPFSILKKTFYDSANQIRDLKPNDVVGIDPCQNDSDVDYSKREWRVNFTGHGDSWNSSAKLIGLKMMPPTSASTVESFEIMQ